MSTADEAAHLLEAGESPTLIARRLGIKLASVARTMHRAGRHDLASRFEFARVGTCAECGAPITSKATRCTPCESPRRHRDESGRWIPTDRRRAS